jgi:hypothetical protein
MNDEADDPFIKNFSLSYIDLNYFKINSTQTLIILKNTKKIINHIHHSFAHQNKKNC